MVSNGLEESRDPLTPLLSSITVLITLSLLMSGCGPQSPREPPRELQLAQRWELQPGEAVAGHQVLSGLGDVSLALGGDAVYAPVAGRVQPYKRDCVIFASEEVPSYLWRLCGVKSPAFGPHRRGEVIGAAEELRLALLNEQADGRWALVEPSKQMVEHMLQPP